MRFALEDHEIRSLYDGARDKKSEVPILAELCAVPVPDMVEKLRELGYTPPEVKIKAPAPSRPKKNIIDDAHALALYQEGLDDLQIAERLGVSVHSVGVWRRKQGLFRKQGGSRGPSRRKSLVKAAPPTPPEAETPETAPAALTAFVPPQTLGRVLLELAAAYPALSVLADGRPVSGLRLDAGTSTLILECEKPC